MIVRTAMLTFISICTPFEQPKLNRHLLLMSMKIDILEDLLNGSSPRARFTLMNKM